MEISSMTEELSWRALLNEGRCRNQINGKGFSLISEIPEILNVHVFRNICAFVFIDGASILERQRSKHLE